MFQGTPRLRDMLDVRMVVVVALMALAAFGLQLGFLAGTVASPLGGAIADFDRVPQTDGAPPEAIARASERAEPVRDLAGGARLRWEWPARTEAQLRAAPPQCLVFR